MYKVNFIKELDSCDLHPAYYVISGSAIFTLYSGVPNIEIEIIANKEQIEQISNDPSFKRQIARGRGICYRKGNIYVFDTAFPLLDEPDDLIKNAAIIEGRRYIDIHKWMELKSIMDRPKDRMELKTVKVCIKPSAN